MAFLVALLLHALLLCAAGWLGGGAGAPWAVLGLLLHQVLETWAAPHRPDTADGSAHLIGWAYAAVVLGSLLFPTASRPAGLVVLAAGIGLRVWAIRTLGPLFLDGMVRRAVHPRVLRGPYRWVRHPAALGTLTCGMGIVAVQVSVVGFLLWAGLLLPLIAWRTHGEDQLW